ncbi:MAG: glycosyl transferase [Leptospiraceae bacterium]|nr:MAG: glycosyl transferase [Leptospiraceae bacterium]
MINILHLNPTKSWRGGEQQTLYLAQFLQTQKDQIKQVVSGNPNSELEKRCQNFNIPYLPLNIKGEWDIFAAKKLTDYIIKNQIQIVHAHTAKAHTIGLIAKKMALKKHYNFKFLVSRRVDFSIKKSKFSFINSITSKKYLSNLIDGYIAISKNVKNILIHDGIPEHKIHIIYSGIDLNRFNQKPSMEKIQQLKKEFSITNEIIIGNVAALVDHKDHQTLLKAIHFLKQENVLPFKVLIAGDGELKSRLLKLKQELKLEEVLFLGYRNDVFDLYYLFDIFVMSSKEEGLGTSLLDAMAMGLPIVATTGGGIPEIVMHNKGGLLSSPRDPETMAKHLKILIQDQNLRKSFSEFNKQFVKQFHYENTAKETLKLYKKVLTE